MFKKQFLAKDNETGMRILYWGTIDDWKAEDPTIVERETILPESEYRAEDYAEMFGNVLEDYNIHKYTNTGHILVDSMRKLGCFTEDQIKETVKEFATQFGQYHNLIRD